MAAISGARSRGTSSTIRTLLFQSVRLSQRTNRKTGVSKVPITAAKIRTNSVVESGFSEPNRLGAPGSALARPSSTSSSADKSSITTWLRADPTSTSSAEPA